VFKTRVWRSVPRPHRLPCKVARDDGACLYTVTREVLEKLCSVVRVRRRKN
jgi:hypothetical protein